MGILNDARKLGFDGQFKQIGFVVDDLSSAQVPYLMGFNSNTFLQNNFGVNICVFFEQNFMPCVPLEFARFNLKDAMTFKGELIATSGKTASLIKNCVQARRYFYINELEYLKGGDIQNWNEALTDDNVLKFTRSQDYYDELTKRGYVIHPKIVKDFDINGILEITNER